jgi:hypothetical protein
MYDLAEIKQALCSQKAMEDFSVPQRKKLLEIAIEINAAQQNLNNAYEKLLYLAGVEVTIDQLLEEF